MACGPSLTVRPPRVSFLSEGTFTDSPFLLPTPGQESLNKSTSIHSVFIFGLRAMSELAKLLDLPTTSLQPPNAPTPLSLDEFAHQMTLAARKHFYDAEKKVFVSGPDRQVSWASQAWSVLAGVPETQQQAAEALKRAYEDDQTVIGNTPYAHHYVNPFLFSSARPRN